MPDAIPLQIYCCSSVSSLCFHLELLDAFSMAMEEKKGSPAASLADDVEKLGYGNNEAATVKVDNLEDGVPRQRFGAAWRLVQKLESYGVEAVRFALCF